MFEGMGWEGKLPGKADDSRDVSTNNSDLSSAASGLFQVWGFVQGYLAGQKLGRRKIQVRAEERSCPSPEL